MLPPDPPSPLGPESMVSKTECECELSSDLRLSMVLMSWASCPVPSPAAGCLFHVQEVDHVAPRPARPAGTEVHGVEDQMRVRAVK